MYDLQYTLEQIPFIVWIVIAIYSCGCFYKIADKLNCDSPALAFIPIWNVLLLCEMASLPWYTALFFLIPILNLFFAAYLFMRISEALDVNKWLGILSVIPVINILFISYLAFKE